MTQLWWQHQGLESNSRLQDLLKKSKFHLFETLFMAAEFSDRHNFKQLSRISYADNVTPDNIIHF